MSAETYRNALTDLATCWERKLVVALATLTASLPEATR